MPQFTGFSNILPTPINPITSEGFNFTPSVSVPGFKAVNVRSSQSTQVGVARSGRRITSRAGGGHRWSFSIQYNEIPWNSFAPVSAFIHSRGGRLRSFFVCVPPYTKPRDPAFATYCLTNTITSVGVTPAGATNILIGAATTISGHPLPGDFFNIVDSTAIDHTKTYKIVGVENTTNFITTGLTTARRRITFEPPLQKEVASGATIRFNEPLFKVALTDDFYEDNIDSDGLVTQSISVEETY